jgi:uncharacterized protein
MRQEEVTKNTILRGTVGSLAFGYNLAGHGDRDEMGVMIEPANYVIGLDHFEQFIHRDAAQRDEDAGEMHADGWCPKSLPGDLDLTVYSLRKFCRLASAGNPNVMTLLFLPKELISTRTHWGAEMQARASMFASRQAAKAYGGYLVAQRSRLLGQRGYSHGKRAELIEQYGYDTKYAMHVVRLGLQGIEYLTTGRLRVPMQVSDQQLLRNIRQGKFAMQQVLDMADGLLEQIDALGRSGHLPAGPDRLGIERFLIDAYTSHWDLTRGYRRAA